MKKLLSVLMALCMMVPMYADVHKSLDKALQKAQQKEMKIKMKEYKKGGWEILGSHSMEVALLKHYNKVLELGDNCVEFSGVSTATKSKNLGEQMALNAATIKYAQKAGSTVKGRVVSDMFADGSGDGDGEFEKFYAAYERLVEQKVKGVMTPSYSVIRKNSDGTYEVQSFFIVDEAKAKTARQAAIEGAIKESELAAKYADGVRGFINDKVED